MATKKKAPKTNEQGETYHQHQAKWPGGKETLDEVQAGEPVEEIVAGELKEADEVVAKDKKDPMYDDVAITIPVGLTVAGEEYPPGRHIIKRHQVDTFVEMVNKKQRANMAIFTGSNYLVEKMVSGALKVTQVENLDNTLSKKIRG